ncbi:hypothetical protein TCAL_12372 [Tigriopus californicus]|uniref:G-protein coupled receptors family 1 profile domain-containing protein n=1 Tax=Tigriopus californicus TaxID=6832 RepID=A0A553PRF0_TIGCA|nr:tachykinin-like peptides receptor 99D [Tigriopus californicus]TRY80241.1 hypothetical protein TCAL_12372 [Tigriopus californicus]
MFDEIGGLPVGGAAVAVFLNDTNLLPFDPLEGEGDGDGDGATPDYLEFVLGESAAANCTDWNQTFLFNGTNFTCGSILTTEDYSYSMPIWRQVMWMILFVAMATVATCGNLIVIWIVMSHQRMRTVTNYFIVNLSIADTMVSSLNVTFNFVYMLYGHWPFGTLYCKVSSYISIISVCGSVFTLMAISIDRYNAIVRPLRPRMGRPSTVLTALLIWIVSGIIALPQLLYFTTQNMSSETENRTVCFAIWPDGPTNESSFEFLYNVAFMIITYFLPMLSMSITYTAVARELWDSKIIGEATKAQMDVIKSKRRVVKMMVMVVFIFGVCWLPYHVYFIISNAYPEINYSPHIQDIYLAIYWLAMSNAMYNPMIYCFMNSRFRQGFMRVFNFFKRIVCPMSFSSGSSGTQANVELDTATAFNLEVRPQRNGTIHYTAHYRNPNGAQTQSLGPAMGPSREETVPMLTDGAQGLLGLGRGRSSEDLPLSNGNKFGKTFL